MEWNATSDKVSEAPSLKTNENKEPNDISSFDYNKTDIDVNLLLKLLSTLGIILFILVPICYISVRMKKKIDNRRQLENMGTTRGSNVTLTKKDEHMLKSRMNRRRVNVNTIQGFQTSTNQGVIGALLNGVQDVVNLRKSQEDAEAEGERLDAALTEVKAGANSQGMGSTKRSTPTTPQASSNLSKTVSLTSIARNSNPPTSKSSQTTTTNTANNKSWWA